MNSFVMEARNFLADFFDQLDGACLAPPWTMVGLAFIVGAIILVVGRHLRLSRGERGPAFATLTRREKLWRMLIVTNAYALALPGALMWAAILATFIYQYGRMLAVYFELSPAVGQVIPWTVLLAIATSPFIARIFTEPR